MRELLGGLLLAAAVVVMGHQEPGDRGSLLRAREQVWRAWFAGDTATLDRLLPDGTLAIDAGDDRWKGRHEVLAAASDFHQKGGRLVDLRFPRTEVQRFGEVAVLYSLYEIVSETGGVRETSRGRATEVFVWRNGRWVNPGWHMDSGR